MIIDKRLQVSAQQALTATAVSTDVIDLGSLRLIGPGDPLWWVIASRVAADFTTGDETYQVSVQTDDASNFPSQATLVSTPAMNGNTLPLGKLIVIPMTFTNERFLRLNYTLAGTTPTWTVDAWLTNQDPQSWIAIADAI